MLSMRKLKPEFLKKNGKTEFVVLTREDYESFCPAPLKCPRSRQ